MKNATLHQKKIGIVLDNFFIVFANFYY